MQAKRRLPLEDPRVVAIEQAVMGLASDDGRKTLADLLSKTGLVFHGLLPELKDRAPARFVFRGLSPLATEDDGGMRLRTARENGPVAASAEVVWS